jgi:peroxiredoxin
MVRQLGLQGIAAPELRAAKWVDGQGESSPAIRLQDLEGKFIVIFCFQAWCEGCHLEGFPDLKRMVEALKGNEKVTFMALQTVFEGKTENTFEKMLETQQKYQLEIPFGHDDGGDGPDSNSHTIADYRAGGTPWFILIDQSGQVVFNDFRLNVDEAIAMLQKVG